MGSSGLRSREGEYSRLGLYLVGLWGFKGLEWVVGS